MCAPEVSVSSTYLLEQWPAPKRKKEAVFPPWEAAECYTTLSPCGVILPRRCPVQDVWQTGMHSGRCRRKCQTVVVRTVVRLYLCSLSNRRNFDGWKNYEIFCSPVFLVKMFLLIIFIIIIFVKKIKLSVLGVGVFFFIIIIINIIITIIIIFI